jgi:hypothetical protein
VLQRVGEQVDAVAKDLKIYAGEEPPPDFRLELRSRGFSGVSEDAAPPGS